MTVQQGTPTRASLDGVARILRGYAAAHRLAADHLQARARAAHLDDSSNDMVRESLYLQAEDADSVAAQFSQVADLLDHAAAEARNQPPKPRGNNVIRCADGGAWVWDEAES